jgi:large subunit ribosomal protein L29
MKIAELKNLKKGELSNLLKDKREKAYDLGLALATSKVKNPKELREVKKDIAKILTILNKK